MNRIALRFYQPMREVHRIAVSSNCILSQRQLSTTTLCQKRVRRPANRRKREKDEESDDHLEAFEKQRQLKEESRKDRRNERQQTENKSKREEKEIRESSDKASLFIVGFLCVSVLFGFYQAATLAINNETQNEFESMDKVPVHRFFEEYLAKGQVADMKLRFVGDDQKEIVVTLVNGRQFITHVSWRKFHIQLAQFEEHFNIHPSERRAGKEFEVITRSILNGPVQDYADYKSTVDGGIIRIGLDILITGAIIFGQGGPKNMRKMMSDMIMMMRKQFKTMEMAQKGKGNKIVPVAKTNVSLKEVAGMNEEKKEIEEFVEFLKNPKKFTRLGAKMPKGVLLSGPPGTGKTMLAKAVANDCNVPFFYKASSEFVKSVVGTGAKDVRELFEQARKQQPCIIFFDELDAIGKKRAEQFGSPETDNTLNQILVELDGMSNRTSDVVVVMAATNAPESLDDALVRPGRFDRKIYCGLPATDGRFEIFNVHLKTVKTEKPPKEYAQILADLTPGMSGAQIANVVNEAALLAARYNSDLVKLEHFESSIERVLAGNKKTSAVNKAEAKRVLAATEAGKCLTAWLLPSQDSVLKASIVPRTHSNVGYTQFNQRERFLKSEEYMMDRMAVLLSGKIAQKVLFGKISARLENDRDSQTVTDMATEMVKIYGMSKSVGQVNLSQDIPYSDGTKYLIDQERSRVINEAVRMSEELLSSHKNELLEIVDFLVKKEVIHSEDLERIIGQRVIESDT